MSSVRKASGVLPKPRNIIVPYAKRNNRPDVQGYADERMVPRGSHGKPLPKTYLSHDQLVKTRAPERKPVTPRSHVHQWHLKMADLRKKYLSTTLVAADKTDAAKFEHHKRYLKAVEKVKEDARGAGLTEAEVLTLPTITGLVAGPQMRRRNADEVEKQRLQRQHNEQLVQLRLEEERARVTVQLIDQADDFIVTEEQLIAGVEKAFVNGSSSGRNPVGGWSVTSFKEDTILASPRNSIGVEGLMQMFAQDKSVGAKTIGKEELTERIALELTGVTNNGKPGLARISEILKGDNVLGRAAEARSVSQKAEAAAERAALNQERAQFAAQNTVASEADDVAEIKRALDDKDLK